MDERPLARSLNEALFKLHAIDEALGRDDDDNLIFKHIIEDILRPQGESPHD